MAYTQAQEVKNAMSMYTTGELAKRCGVSVRTVQYYDTRSILVPSQLSEGGRRLYSEDDLKRMKIICFLRELGLPINDIAQILKEEQPESVISLILSEQEKALQQELKESQSKLEQLQQLQKNLRQVEHLSVQSIGDMAQLMKSKEKLKKVRLILLGSAIPMGVMEWTSILLWIIQGIWWPFALYTALAIPYTVWIFAFYCRKVAFLCPGCHQVFRAKKKEVLFASHTATTRKLTCPCCGRKGFCVETYGEEEK